MLLSQVAAASTADVTLSVSQLKDMSSMTAVAYGLDPVRFMAVIDCESKWNTTAQSKFVKKDGTRERSFGLVQINLDAHTDVSESDAKSPFFALNWMAVEWKQGKQNEWTCYREGA